MSNRRLAGLAYGGMSLARWDAIDVRPYSQVCFEIALRRERQGQIGLAQEWLEAAIFEEEEERKGEQR